MLIKLKHIFGFIAALFMLLPAYSDELVIGKVCPIEFADNSLGILAFSQPWFHDGMQSAAYQPRDNDIGVGLEIHFFANAIGNIKKANLVREIKI